MQRHALLPISKLLLPLRPGHWRHRGVYGGRKWFLATFDRHHRIVNGQMNQRMEYQRTGGRSRSIRVVNSWLNDCRPIGDHIRVQAETKHYRNAELSHFGKSFPERFHRPQPGEEDATVLLRGMSFRIPDIMLNTF